MIAWRQRRERLVERIKDFTVFTSFGEAQAFSYRTSFEEAEHLVLKVGKVEPNKTVLVRIHRERLVEDVFGPQLEHDKRLIDLALERLVAAGGGVFIYLRAGSEGVPFAQLHHTARASRETKRTQEWLEIGVGAQILADLGLKKIKILAGRKIDYVGLEGFGLQVQGTEILS